MAATRLLRDERAPLSNLARVWLGLIVILGAIVTLGVSSWAHRVHGVYWSEVNVHFVAATNPSSPNGLQSSATSLIMLAGAVGQMIDDSDPPRTADSTVTLADEGVRSGSLVQLPNNGGQWQLYYADPVLQVQAVGASGIEVSATMNHLIEEIRTDLTLLQDRTTVSKYNLVTARLLPNVPPAVYVQVGSRIRALATALVVGIGLTVAMFWFVRRTAQSRATRQGPEPAAQKAELQSASV